MKTKHYYSLFILILTTFLFFTASSVNSSGDDDDKEVKSKIKFPHATHKDAVDCVTCHSGITNSTNLSENLYPKKEDCSGCHDVEDENNCTTCHYEGVFEPLGGKNSDLIFNHKQHLEGDVTCTKCHAGIEETTADYVKGEYNPAMENCYTCHNDYSALPTECNVCHISTADLTPESHKAPGYEKLHKFAANSPSANCMMCHDDNSCEECHVSTNAITEMNTKTDFYAPYAPVQTFNGASLQKITKVHDLGFRFTHGISAKGKENDCSTCHQVETFCNECHDAASEDYAYSGVLPVSHTKPSFIMIGIGSGGGEHAKLALRDIENCASCHDVQGADPACISCHVDNDGIKGTNPKTHAKNFMKDMDDGDWHSEVGSVCYTCHTDANAKPNGIAGIGFCGYCHGSM